MVGIVTAGEEKRSVEVDAIPTKPMKWEYLLMLYMVFAGWLVWFISEYMLVWNPEEEMWGLPKPVAGMLLAGYTWVVMCIVTGLAYYYIIKRRIEFRLRGGKK